MNEIYVAQEVVRRRQFDGYAFAHDLVGCRTHDSYYIKEEVVFIIGKKELGFLYLDGNMNCNVLDLNVLSEIYNPNNVYSCNVCQKSALLNGSNCEERIDTIEEVIGITNIMKINEFTNCDDVSSSVRYVEEYNEKVKNKYIMINGKDKVLCRVKNTGISTKSQ